MGVVKTRWLAAKPQREELTRQLMGKHPRQFQLSQPFKPVVWALPGLQLHSCWELFRSFSEQVLVHNRRTNPLPQGVLSWQVGWLIFRPKSWFERFFLVPLVSTSYVQGSVHLSLCHGSWCESLLSVIYLNNKGSHPNKKCTENADKLQKI